MTRNYDAEAKDHPKHRYAYNFDYRMHGYMLRTFEPFMVPGHALELGCFEGHFTKRLIACFDRVDVVEASADCIEAATRFVGEQVTFHHARFEDFEPQQRYDSIFLIHTLEHLDDPIRVLERIRGWLTPGGRLFVATPNAHAGSRQIAVRMGLIEHAAAVTTAEAAHGHSVTYSLDTLNADLRSAGLRSITCGGVFFKGLANFQLDAALEAGIISDAYLDGCYELGRVYPDLCSSVYAVCESGIEDAIGS